MKWYVKLLQPLARGIGCLSPSCRQASRLQSEALDHQLSPLQRLGLRIHLLLCKWCRRYGKQLRFLHDAVRQHPDDLAESVPQTLSDEARQRIKQQLRAKGE